jgi:hypothetical protein
VKESGGEVGGAGRGERRGQEGDAGEVGICGCGVDVGGGDEPAAAGGRGVGGVGVALRGDHAGGAGDVVGAWCRRGKEEKEEEYYEEAEQHSHLVPSFLRVVAGREFVGGSCMSCHVYRAGTNTKTAIYSIYFYILIGIWERQPTTARLRACDTEEEEEEKEGRSGWGQLPVR